MQYFTKFASELETCQWTFMSGQLEDAQELEMMRSIVAMYVLAGLVGPGTFAGELGCSTEVVGTALETRMSRLNDDHAAKYQLQPIVFNGNGPWDYYTDTAGPLVFTAEEIVRFGRSDDSDPHWLEEYRGIAMTDRSVSRKHAQLEHTASGWYLTDVGSANGTIILRGHNGGRVFRKKGFTENERRMRVSTGDIFFFAPSGGHRYDARLKPMRIPNVEQHVVGKAFRFERIER